MMECAREPAVVSLAGGSSDTLGASHKQTKPYISENGRLRACCPCLE